VRVQELMRALRNKSNGTRRQLRSNSSTVQSRLPHDRPTLRDMRSPTETTDSIGRDATEIITNVPAQVCNIYSDRNMDTMTTAVFGNAVPLR
jgi:hypothetical protein